MGILRDQFPEVMGLSTPITSEEDLMPWPTPDGLEHRSYAPMKPSSAYIQILHTGKDHWITSFKPKSKCCYRL